MISDHLKYSPPDKAHLLLPIQAVSQKTFCIFLLHFLMSIFRGILIEFELYILIAFEVISGLVIQN